MEQGNEPFS